MNHGGFISSGDIAFNAIRHPLAKLPALQNPTLIVCLMNSGNVIVLENHLSDGRPTPTRPFLKYRRNMQLDLPRLGRVD
jgi:hypothetical protein